MIKRSLFIEGREWFDRSAGSTYFSARIWVDGSEVATIGLSYGYGDSYLYEAQKKLLELGYLKQDTKNAALSSIARSEGFDFYTVKTLGRKKDLFRTEVV